MKKWEGVAMETEKERMEWTLTSEDQSLNWCWVIDEETAMCSWGLKKLHYGFGLHSLVSFFIFLD